ncbi:hypothetical protein KF7_0114 [Lactococcus lactis subsp. lactis]|uniref:hypothetical protein n=1 Tax=Lactococcus lactis TaxID=1358 RepID=UPI00071CC014|nr:hypothetical protein [Lactococcus lactis]KST87382.1 hypothetical protein KF7_0114 [Lactococcus lactis subsp. lactis]
MKNKFDSLKKENEANQKGVQEIITNLNNIQEETKRVSLVAKNVNIIISDLDKQFESATKLKKVDIVFLFLATALQITRQYLLAKSTNNAFDMENRPNDKEAAKKADGPFKHIMQEKYHIDNRGSHFYHISVEEVWSKPVPFDVQSGSTNFGINMGGGNYHRLATAGHDPILGWLFGTANIATRTVTTLPTFESFHVKYGNDFFTRSGEQSKRAMDFMSNHAQTSKVLQYGITNRILHPSKDRNLEILISALAMEAIHLKSDYSSRRSLSLPFAGLSPTIAKKASDMGIDMASVGHISKQVGIAVTVNTIVSLLHRLLILSTEEIMNTNLLQVRTNKIITYSNTIATASNLAYIGATAALKGAPDMKALDIGGFLVTLYKLISSVNFQNKVKEEFLEKEFYNKVMNE